MQSGLRLLSFQYRSPAVSHQAISLGHPYLGVLNLPASALTPELHNDLSHLPRRLGADGFPETREPTAGAYGQSPSDPRLSVPKHFLRFSFPAEAAGF